MFAGEALHGNDRLTVVVFGNEDEAEACFNSGDCDGDAFTVDYDFVFRFHRFSGGLEQPVNLGRGELAPPIGFYPAKV